MMLGFMTFIVGLQADVIANNRKLLEDIQYRVRRLDYKESEREEAGADPGGREAEVNGQETRDIADGTK